MDSYAGIAFDRGTSTHNRIAHYKCKWKYHGPIFLRKWTAECGLPDENFQVPSVKKFNYCPYCGKEIEITIDEE